MKSERRAFDSRGMGIGEEEEEAVEEEECGGEVFADVEEGGGAGPARAEEVRLVLPVWCMDERGLGLMGDEERE